VGLCDPGHSFCCTEGVSIVRFSSFPKIKLGSKLIDHRPNKLKGVLRRSSRCWLGNFFEENVVVD
jgi:hypothetical protein